MSHYTMPYKYDRSAREFLGAFSIYFHFSLVLHDFEGFLIKQLFHSRLLDMRWLQISIISYLIFPARSDVIFRPSYGAKTYHECSESLNRVHKRPFPHHKRLLLPRMSTYVYLVYIIFITVLSILWKYQIKVLRLRTVGWLARKPAHISHKTWKENH